MYETGELAEMFQTHGIDVKPSHLNSRYRSCLCQIWYQKSGGLQFQLHEYDTIRKIPAGPIMGC